MGAFRLSDKSGSDAPAVKRKSAALGGIVLSLVVASLMLVVWLGQVDASDHTLDLTDTSQCNNRIPISDPATTLGQDMTWYEADGPMPQEWAGQRVDGTLETWRTGARFSSGELSVTYSVTTKWGLCSPAIN